MHVVNFTTTCYSGESFPHVNNIVNNNNRNSNNLNFLRLFFALLVLLSHAFEIVDGNRQREILTRLFGTVSFGDLAVDGFFLLSGYLIVQSWTYTPIPSQFLRNRVLRIYPAFIIATLICALIVGPLGATKTYFDSFDTTEFLKGILTLQAPVVPSTFSGTPYAMTNGSMWTISLEFCCYLLVLVAGLLGVIRQRWLWALLTALIFVLALMFKFDLPPADFAPVVNWVSPFVRVSSFFFVGGCVFLFRERSHLIRALPALRQ